MKSFALFSSLLAVASALVLPVARDLPSFMIGIQSGDGTFYDTGMGACGFVSSPSEAVAAVSFDLFNQYPGFNGGNPNLNPICNQVVTATYGGKSIKVRIVDKCSACKLTDLDFSPSVFTQWAPQSVGRIHDVKWTWDTPPSGTPGTPTNPPTSPPPSSGACAGVGAWSASTVYVGGLRATYNGHLWTAKWWTQGETPGASDVWSDSGKC